MQLLLEICFVFVLVLAIPSVVYLVRPGMLPAYLRDRSTGASARAHLIVTFAIAFMILPRLAHWNPLIGLACAIVALAVLVWQFVAGRRSSST